ncbi:MAG: hypothetical protein Q9187_003093 [Circinaria calcarea]
MGRIYLSIQHDTDVSAKTNLPVVNPSLSGQKEGIVQAAANAGFDVSNRRALSDLIAAVDHARRLSYAVEARLDIYPDFWNGPASYQSDTYPDRWVPGHRTRTPAIQGRRLRTITRSPEPSTRAVKPSKTQAHTGRLPGRPCSPIDEEITRSLPPLNLGTEPKSFDLPLRALLRAREDASNPSVEEVTVISEPVKTGSNQQPLGSRKRHFPGDSNSFVPSKVPKFEDAAMMDSSSVHDGLLISTADSREQTADTGSRSALDKITNSNHSRSKGGVGGRGTVDPARGNRASRKPSLSAGSTHPYGSVISKSTQKAGNEGNFTKLAFEKVKDKLQLSVDNMQKDRDTLSKRWEADAQLRESAAMVELTQLSEHLGAAEEGLKQAVQVIERIVKLK